jgi:hypothetical protein
MDRWMHADIKESIMAAEPAENTSPAPKKSSKLMLIGGAIAGFVTVQVVVLFVVLKALNQGPLEAAGVEIEDPQAAAASHDAEHGSKETAEVLIAKLDCPHTSTGRLYMIRMSVYATVPANMAPAPAAAAGGGGHGAPAPAAEGESHGPDVGQLIEKYSATIRHQMRTIIAAADPGTLCLTRAEKPDYGLLTLRRQFKSVLDEVFGKGIVKDVLISDYMPRPVD